MDNMYRTNFEGSAAEKEEFIFDISLIGDVVPLLKFEFWECKFAI